MNTEMKKLRFIKTVFLAIILLGVMTNCERDEISSTGNLSLSFTNHPSDISVAIYSIGNLDIPIKHLQLDSNGQAQEELNRGNYYIKVFSETFFSPTGFQIKADQTTTITWGANNESRVQ